MWNSTRKWCNFYVVPFNCSCLLSRFFFNCNTWETLAAFRPMVRQYFVQLIKRANTMSKWTRFMLLRSSSSRNWRSSHKPVDLLSRFFFNIKLIVARWMGFVRNWYHALKVPGKRTFKYSKIHKDLRQSFWYPILVINITHPNFIYFTSGWDIWICSSQFTFKSHYPTCIHIGAYRPILAFDLKESKHV